MDSWVAKYWHKLFSNKEQEAPEDSIHGQSEPSKQTGENLRFDSEDVANAAGEGSVRAIGFQEKGGDYSDGSGPSGTVSFGRGGRSRQLSLRGYFVKQSCRLYRERVGMEEYYYVYNSVQSQTTLKLRPLLVKDGSLIITSASNSFNESKQNIEKSPSRTRAVPSPSGGGGAFHSQGSPNGMLLLFLGFTFGIMFTTVANKREVDNLNDLLNQTKNLVQYLHEELEMKDLYIVKEEGDEDFESRGTNEFPFLNHTPIASSTEPELDKSTKYDQKERDYHKAEDSEAITKIEAELEAELERLELNMKTSSLEKISDYVELDPDFVVDVFQGDLTPVKVQRLPGGLSDSDCDATGTSSDHTHTANYSLSPRELSIRLHEVIHLQLEARIMELQNALENTQKRLHSMESENMIPQNKFVNDMDRPFINF